MLNISEKTILDEVEVSSTYKKGLNYFTQGRVIDFKFFPEDYYISATVLGTQNYNINIELEKSGEIVEYSCDCEAYHSYLGMCKHIVAVLKRAQTTLSSNKVIEFNKASIKPPSRIFSYFDQVNQQNVKKAVNLEVNYQFARVWGSKPLSALSLKIGESKLYSIKNIKDFLDTLDKNASVEFGKNFTFDSNIHTFNQKDQAIIDLVKELYEHEKTMSSLSYSYGRSSVFQGKSVFLPENSARKLFSHLKGKIFNASIHQNNYKNVSVLEDSLPVEITLIEDNNDLILNWHEKETLIPITDKCDYFFCSGNIYEVPKEQSIYLQPLYKAFTEMKNTIRIPSQEKQRFVSEILPLTQKTSKVIIDKTIAESLMEAELLTEIYFDKIQDGISAKIIFNYNDEKIDPFGENKVTSDKIIIRDMQKERKILSIFEGSEFKVNRDVIYLQDDDKIFEFIYSILPQLRELAEIFYSDQFKNITVRDSAPFSGGVRLNEDSDLLEFSFHCDDIDTEELKNIFSSLHEKKKYHRLKNGSFIPLESPELLKMSELIECLNISDKDLSKKVIELPKFRAMYIDNQIRESNMTHIERNSSFKRMVQNIKEPEDMDFVIPQKLQHVLRDYQKTGFKWLKTLASYGFGGILADDMGLGKTLQAIAFIQSEKEKSSIPSLVVAPTSLVYNWQDEINKFAPDLKSTVISGLQKERQEQIKSISEADIVITSYPLIRRDIDLYNEFKFKHCFLDEAQQIKNPESINAKSVKQINAGSYFALTGTPLENSLSELWSIFDFLMPGYLLSHTKFLNKFERPIVKHKNEKALKELGRHISPFILRRLKKDVLKELPEKIESKMTAELTDEQKKLYLAYLQKAKGEIAQEIASKGFEKSQIKILAYLTRLRQLCCHPSLFIENYKGGSGKLDLLQEILEDALDGGHRILLFSQFTSMLKIIRQYLDQNKIEYYYLDGSTKAEERVRLVKEFNSGQKSIFLISLKAGGTGLNLTGADMVVHFDPWWNPAVEDQATDRAYRIGQKNVVQVMKLITQGTIEEKIFALQQKKREMINSVIQPGETMLSKMSEAEIRSLFEL